MDTLTLHRARATGALASRERLAAALGWWREDPGARDEWLLVPHLAITAPSPRDASPTAMARRLDAALARARASATVDPAPGVFPSGAVRFTTQRRWLAWLAQHLSTPETYLPPASAPLPGDPPALRLLLRRMVLADPAMLLFVARALLASGGYAPWVASWTAQDARQAMQALAAGFGLPPEIASATMGDNPANLRAVLASLPNASPHAARQARRVLAAMPERPGADGPESNRFAARLLSAIAMRPALAVPLLHAIVESVPADAKGAACHDEPVAAPLLQAGIAPNLRAVRAGLTAIALPAGTPATSPRVVDTLMPLPGSRNGPASRAPTLPVGQVPQGTQAAIDQPRYSAGEDVPWMPVQFTSQNAGFLFLINALLALGLYPDFTRPRDPRLAPSPLRVIALLGRHWLGRRFAADPLCAWLERTGAPGALPACWTLATDWEPGAPPPRRYRAEGLAIAWDPRGFAAQMRPIRPHEAHRPALPASLTRRLALRGGRERRWIACLATYLEHRLAEAGTCLADLRLPGRIIVADEAVTARFALADLPLALRLAGLDRNPGWLPAEGRTFGFAFA